MRSALNRFCLLSVIALASLTLVLGAIAQTKSQSPQKPQSAQKKNSSQADTQKPNQQPNQQNDTIKFDTDLVTVPVIASDRADVYVPDLAKEEFTIHEDGVKQEIEFFAAVRTPFNVVLMLDTSASTQEKLGQIQRAAKMFVEQLQPADRVKVISFDDGIYELVEFTSDRSELRKAIDSTRPGQGTKLYDAVRVALGDLARVKGRKAIVIFTDGVDWRSDSTKYDDNIRQLEESSVIVYPIRFDTRHDTEALLRDQQERGETVDLGGILGGPANRVPPGTTPPTVPGGQGNPVPSRRGGIDPMRLPIPPIIIGGGGRYPDRYPGGGGRYPDDRYPRDRYPDNRYPDNRYPRDRYPDNRYPDDRSPRTGRYPDDRYPDPRYPDSRNPSRRRDENISIMLDGLYRTADQYLQELAVKSGGELHRADTLRSLPDAFANIAAELRNQYSLGYYPANQTRDGKYRKIQVKTSRKDVVIRARPGYRAPGANSNARGSK
ncbi:MAG: VWA domain-containing protein [Blastocatellales bacterium]